MGKRTKTKCSVCHQTKGPGKDWYYDFARHAQTHERNPGQMILCFVRDCDLGQIARNDGKLSANPRPDDISCPRLMLMTPPQRPRSTSTSPVMATMPTWKAVPRAWSGTWTARSSTRPTCPSRLRTT